MDLFDLQAKITLDTSEYEKGLHEAEKDAQETGETIFDKLQSVLGLDTGEFSQKLNDAKEKASTFVNDMADKAFDISMDVENGDFESALGKTKDELKRFGTFAVDTFKKIPKGWKIAGAGIATAGAAAFGAYKIATSDASKKLMEGIKETAKYGAEIDKLSKKVNMTAEGYQKWSYVMDAAGISSGALGTAMKAVGKAADKNNDSFQKLGISQKEVASLSDQELFERSIKGLAQMGDNAERSAIATELFGNASSSLTPLLSEGADALDEYIEKGEKFGIVMSDDAVKAAADYDNAVTNLDNTFKALKFSLLSGFLPAVTKVTDGIAKIVKGDGSGMDDIVEGVKDFIDAFGEMIPKIADIAITIIEGLGQALSDHGEDLTDSIVQLFSTIVQILIDNLPIILKGLGEIVGELAAGLLYNLPTILTAIWEFIKAAAESLIQTFKEFLGINSPSTVFAQFGLDIINGLLSTLKELPSKVLEVFSKVLDKVKEFGENVKEKAKKAGKNLVTGLWSGITSKFKWLVGKIKEFTNGVTGKLKKFFKIESPSKVMRDEVGKYLAEGIGVGFIDNVPIDEMEDALDFNFEIPQFETSYAIATTTDENDKLYTMFLDFFPVLLDAIEAQKEVTIDGRKVISYVDAELGKKYAQKARGN